MSVVPRIDHHLDEANPVVKIKAHDAAQKILSIYVGGGGSIRDILSKSKAVKSVNDITKLIDQITNVIVKELG